MGRTLRITIVESSEIVRTGLVAMLGRMPGARVEIHEIADTARLRDHLAWNKPEIVVVNPAMIDPMSLQKIRKEWPAVKCVALMVSVADPAVVRLYDAEISIYDDGAAVCEKIEKLAAKSEEEIPQEQLSAREKDVLAEIVGGLTNKQIADKLNLSANTVISHRRNISTKLGIHSTAGLTVYAIVNKIITLNSQ